MEKQHYHKLPRVCQAQNWHASKSKRNLIRTKLILEMTFLVQADFCLHCSTVLLALVFIENLVLYLSHQSQKATREIIIKYLRENPKTKVQN